MLHAIKLKLRIIEVSSKTYLNQAYFYNIPKIDLALTSFDETQLG